MSDDDLTQDHPGPDTGKPQLIEEYGYAIDRNETQYIPFIDGWAVGFKVIPPDGVVQWVYLNPSSDGDDERQADGSYRPWPSNVFVYHDQDEGEGPHFCGAVTHIVTYPGTPEA